MTIASKSLIAALLVSFALPAMAQTQSVAKPAAKPVASLHKVAATEPVKPATTAKPAVKTDAAATKPGTVKPDVATNIAKPAPTTPVTSAPVTKTN